MLATLTSRSATALRDREPPAMTDPVLRCSACHQTFRDRVASVNHARIEHNRDYTACRVVTFGCRACGQDLPNSDAWRSHQVEAHRGRARAREREWSVSASWPTMLTGL